jgi:hypothetical protein
VTPTTPCNVLRDPAIQKEKPSRDFVARSAGGIQMRRNMYARSSDGARHNQLDLFNCTPTALASTGVAGLTILTGPCPRCGNTAALVGSSCAMHCARLSCCGCGRHVRWVSRQDFQRLSNIVDAVGHPAGPIDLRHSFVTGLSSHGAY